LYAFQDAFLKKEIIGLLEQEEITSTQLDRILELVINAPEVCKLGNNMHLWVKEATQNIFYIKRNSDLFIQLLKSTLEDLPS
jgi:hypothetical protein